jgi:hypothetical protein
MSWIEERRYRAIFLRIRNGIEILVKHGFLHIVFLCSFRRRKGVVGRPHLDISLTYSYIYTSHKEARNKADAHQTGPFLSILSAFFRLKRYKGEFRPKFEKGGIYNLEEAMFLRGKRALRKNMAIFVCVAFVILLLPHVTHAASRSSSKKSSLSQIAFTFSISNLIVSNFLKGSTNPDSDLARTSSGNVKSKKKPKKDRD